MATDALRNARIVDTVMIRGACITLEIVIGAYAASVTKPLRRRLLRIEDRQ
jgi:hypothetical protein